MLIHHKLDIHQLAPQFQLPDLNGVVHTLSENRGRIAVLNFWSVECAWSERVDRELLPLLEVWGEDVALLPIASNANEEPELLASVAAARGLANVLLDEGHRVADLYGAETTPHFFVVDPDGELGYQGAFDDVTFRQRMPQVSYLQLAIEALMEGKQPEPAETPAYGCALVRTSP